MKVLSSINDIVREWIKDVSRQKVGAVLCLFILHICLAFEFLIIFINFFARMNYIQDFCMTRLLFYAT